ncbi:methyltransferase domain-containing protein [Saccharibacter sp. 17.LH.SD]|uniref:class I SAM-dependent methyltransferase n=1 Tax=Saccharibacter sp. 17.LH.SD TaxID=2689393 RepID=UPI00137185C3|nr:methyltransferase domain-containing protein [Saccharibacter sp. 17.LH.SD]
MQGLHEKAFLQASHEPDETFFARQGFDSLMDMGARTAITALYRTTLPVGGRTLDLMSGAMSHMPEDAVFQELIGLDVCQPALEANKALTRFTVQNLNTKPELPFEDESFDGVVLCDGLVYLTQPQKVMEEIFRVLKPNVPLIVSFSDRFIPAKAVAIWQALEPEDRVRLVSALMTQAGFTDLDTGEVVPPEDLTAWKDTVRAVVGRRPAGQ